jgi:alpha-N-arabinofuranosidase
MVTYARGLTVNGPFESYEKNPVLTNRNLGGFFIQGIGHGDLIQAYDGNYWMIHLGFRQTGQWTTFHHLGREVFLTPVTFDSDGWFTAGSDGTTKEFFEAPHLTDINNEKKIYTFENTDNSIDWSYLRFPDKENYCFYGRRSPL